MYRLLAQEDIPIPRHIVVDRDHLQPGEDPEGFEETEDYVMLGGVKIMRPFVEKPVDANDHNIWIYYPKNIVGGLVYCWRL